MINKNEIRLGNWYHHNENWSYHDKPGPFNFQWTAYDWVAFAECRLDLKNIFPIELTPEVLEEFGFKGWHRTVSLNAGYEGGDIFYAFVDGHDEFGQKKIRHGFVINCVIEKKYSDSPTYSFWYGRGGPKKGLHIKSLHQLQNLWLDLTGEELKPGSLIAP